MVALEPIRKRLDDVLTANCHDRADAEFFAHARADIAELLDEVEMLRRNQEPQHCAEMQVLVQAVLGLLDRVSDHMVHTIDRRAIATYSTRIPTVAVYALFDALETVQPGLFASYVEIRRQRAGHRVRQTSS